MDKLEDEARCWTKKSSKSFEISRIDAENMLKFSVDSETGKSANFSITCTDFENGKFSVWSDSPELLPYMSNVIDYCESATTKTLTTILDKLNEVVDKVFKEYNDAAEEDADDDDDDDFNDNYYDNDVDADRDTEVVKKESSEDEDEETFFGSNASPTAFQRLTKDLKNMKKEAHKFGIIGNPRGDNLFIWDVKLTGFSNETKLGQDIEAFATKYNREPVVYLEMQFPGEFPMAPPFVRVIRPRFKFLTGHVTIGGSICMEMLTRSGWLPTNDIEGILVQIRAEIMSDKNARLDPNPDKEYGETEARDAFNRMVSRYGWNK